MDIFSAENYPLHQHLVCTVKLHELAQEGREEGPEAEEWRERSQPFWESLTEAQRHFAGAFSESLWILWDLGMGISTLLSLRGENGSQTSGSNPFEGETATSAPHP
jgi:hypothetical protein